MDQDNREQLLEQGYCVLRNLLADEELTALRELAARCVAATTPEHRARYRSEGSLVLMAEYPQFARIIGYAPALQAFAALGLEDVRFSSGYVISKPPASPALFWHQDWWGWDHPLSFSDRIVQFFAFYYLTDTTPENGCLRVIPGSHRRRHALHELGDAHQAGLAEVMDPGSPAFANRPDQVDVPVRAGDLVIGDVRLMHGSHPNASEHERTLLTLWYHPGYSTLPEPIRARIQELYCRRGVDTDPDADQQQFPDNWPEPYRSKIAAQCPDYAGAAAPQPWNRSPDGLR